MRLSVTALRGEVGRAMTLEESLEFKPLRHQGEVIRFSDPLELTARLENTGTALRLAGELRGFATLDCQRCLVPFTHELLAPLASWYQTPQQKAEMPLEDVVDRLEVYEGKVVDITGAVEEGILLGLPAKYLCHEECRGICPVCGQNQNERECHCVIEDIDPRMAKLKDWSLNR